MTTVNVMPINIDVFIIMNMSIFLQTIANVFALCGPLQLPLRSAVVADECYNGGFMVGRFLSMFVVDRVAPRRMLKWSSIACLLAAAAVAAKADESAAVLYACAIVFGFAISWQFGAAYSWASEHIDVVVIYLITLIYISRINYARLFLTTKAYYSLINLD